MPVASSPERLRTMATSTQIETAIQIRAFTAFSLWAGKRLDPQMLSDPLKKSSTCQRDLTGKGNADQQQSAAAGQHVPQRQSSSDRRVRTFSIRRLLL